MQPNIQSQLEKYHALLVQWQNKINLVSPNTIDDAWNRHFVDSIQVEKFIPSNVQTICDIGSGAGFPGLVLAIMRPDIQFEMIESDSRKCAFLRNVSRETGGNNVTIHTSRIEDKISEMNIDCVTARALASLKMLVEYTKPQWENNPKFTMVLHKGQQYESELEEAKTVYNFDYDACPSETNEDAIILIVSNIDHK